MERTDCEACNMDNVGQKALEIAGPDEKTEKVCALFVGIGEKKQRGPRCTEAILSHSPSRHH